MGGDTVDLFALYPHGALAAANDLPAIREQMAFIWKLLAMRN